MLLITGGTGFLGSHLINKSIKQGRKLLHPSSQELDLLDYKKISQYINDHKIEKIIHAAGYVGGIGLHEEHPAKIASSNLEMGMNIVKASSNKKNTRLITISTVCIYPKDGMIPLKECNIHQGYPAEITGFYGYSKRMIDVLCDAYKKEHGLNYLTIIPTNLYGPGDNYELNKSHVVSALIRRVHEAKENNLSYFEVWGNKETTRDFLFAPDCSFWILKALDSNISGSSLNFGSGEEITIENLTKLICDVIGYDGDIKWDNSRPIGADRRFLDTSKASKLIDYKNLTNLKDGLKETYKDFLLSH